MNKYRIYRSGIFLCCLIVLQTTLILAQENHPLQNESSIWDSDEIIINVNSSKVKYNVFDLIDNCVTDDCLELRGEDKVENITSSMDEGQTFTCNLTEDRMQEVVSYQINTSRTLRIIVSKLDSIDYSIEHHSFVDIENVNINAHSLTSGDFDSDGLDEIILAYYHNQDDSVIVKLYDTDGSVNAIRMVDDLYFSHNASISGSHKGINASVGDFNMDNDSELGLIWTDKNSEEDSINFMLSIISVDSMELKRQNDNKLFSTVINGGNRQFIEFELDALAAPFFWHHKWNDNIITPRDELALLLKLTNKRTDKSENEEQETITSIRLINFNDSLSAFELPYIESDSILSSGDDSNIDLTEGRIDDDPDFDLVVYAGNRLKILSFDNENGVFSKIIDENFNLNTNNNNIPSKDFLQVADLNADGKFEILTIEGLFDRDNTSNPAIITLNMYEVNEVDGNFELENLSTTTFEEEVNLDIKSISIASGDFDGDRVRYGIPKVYSESEYLQPIVVLSAPPTHFDILDNEIVDLTNCFTGDCDFSSLFEKTRSETREISVEVRSDWAIDSKLTASLEETVTIGTKGKNVSGSLKIEGYVSGKYGESFTKVENSAEELSIKVSAEALKEDMVYATISDYTIYEYPVYIDDSIGGYFTMVVPDNVRKSWFSTKSIKGLDFVDRHEVGNALSYTALELEDNPDIAEFVNPGATQINYTIGPNSKYEWSLEFRDFKENQIRTQTDISYGFGASVEASVSASGRVSGWKLAVLKAFLKAISKVELKITAKIEGNYINNSSSVTTHTVKVEEELLLRSNFGKISNQYNGADYSVSPVTYWAANGALVLDYEVKPALSPQGYDETWWQKNYSAKPDLSFILPWKYDPEKDLKLNSNDQRYFSKDIAIKNDGELTRGDTINFIVRAHNYSFKPIFEDIDVAFYLGDPDNGGYPIFNENNENVVTMDGMLDRDFNLAEFNWVVPLDMDICHPRIYVVLDPEDKLGEIHENNNKAFTIIQLNNRDFNCLSYAEVFPSQQVQSQILVTGLEDGINDPSGILLEQNTPNPSTNLTTIKYHLTDDNDLSINVYDLEGRMIENLVSGYQREGSHTIDLNLTKYEDGIYVYRLNSKNGSISKRLVVVK